MVIVTIVYLSDMTQQDGDVSYNVSLKLDLNYDSVADGKEDLIEALVYNYLLDIDETARYDNFEVSRGQSSAISSNYLLFEVNFIYWAVVFRAP